MMSGCRAPKADRLGDLNPIQRGTTAAIHKIVSFVSFRDSAVAEPRSAKPIKALEAYAALPPGVVELCSDMPTQRLGRLEERLKIIAKLCAWTKQRSAHRAHR